MGRYIKHRGSHDDSMFGAPMDGFGDAMFYFAIFGFIVFPLLFVGVALLGNWLLGWQT